MPHENVLCSWSLTGASRGTRKRGTSANRLRRLGARSRRRVRSSASPVAASTFPPSGLCRSPATRKSHEKSRKNCLPGTDHELYASSESLFPVLGCDKSFVTFRETFVSRRAAETPRRGGFSCSARSAARLVNCRLHLPRNRRTVNIPRTRARGSLLLSLTCLRPSRGSWASRRHAENRKARPL